MQLCEFLEGMALVETSPAVKVIKKYFPRSEITRIKFGKAEEYSGFGTFRPRRIPCMFKVSCCRNDAVDRRSKR